MKFEAAAVIYSYSVYAMVYHGWIQRGLSFHLELAGVNDPVKLVCPLGSALV